MAEDLATYGLQAAAVLENDPGEGPDEGAPVAGSET